MALADTILRRIQGTGRGAVFTARDFLDLGARAAVDQALARLSRAGTIRRIDRGIYDFPRVHPHIGLLWPSADVVAQAIARQTDSHLKSPGPLAANALGLTTQVPAHAIYLTDGPSRTVHVGNLVVEMKHAGRIDMLLPDTTAGLAITALHYLGREGVSEDVLRQVSTQLDATDKQKLVRVRKQLPDWLGTAVAQLASA